MESKIPPKNEWASLSSMQLQTIKYDLLDIYYKLKPINENTANNYLKLSQDAEHYSNQKQMEEQQKSAEDL